MTPHEFARSLNGLSAGTMIESMEMLEAGEGRARCRMEFKPHLRQLTGLFHAGAIVGLADTAATAAAMWELNPSGELRPELFPLSIQVAANLIRNRNRGTLTADAELIHRGQSTMIAEVRVIDDESRLIARVTVTLMVPRVSAKERAEG